MTAYKRQADAYVTWLQTDGAEHEDAFTDVVCAEAAVTAWCRHLMIAKAAPATINQALAAAAPGTARSWPPCCTPGPGWKNAPSWRSPTC
ncbi:uncharacterized protein with NAD-binding domain and iron-sulfur cluster [Thermocatellispora tengchongensis]|uniref:Uncharacterized protein with NAD-binding domain and iron-sulfur cluster n=1 Tax=Thermocatellispora tengchongensis TaxID=1073253 RepID=A0A840PAX7_9ACTN|nr:hypothetical protein [Thermocatellispora tengchongensis]MBB5136159.1 uncharacterized protein with NAD-binding domain and iron-sulfur cluster [Thermocatellispora tengchongensis]